MVLGIFSLFSNSSSAFLSSSSSSPSSSGFSRSYLRWRASILQEMISCTGRDICICLSRAVTSSRMGSAPVPALVRGGAGAPGLCWRSTSFASSMQSSTKESRSLHRCFSSSAVMEDRGILHVSRTALKAWNHHWRTSCFRACACCWLSVRWGASPPRGCTRPRPQARPPVLPVDGRSPASRLSLTTAVLALSSGASGRSWARYLLIGSCGRVRNLTSLVENLRTEVRSSFMLRSCSESTATSRGSTMTFASFRGASCLRVVSQVLLTVTCASSPEGNTKYWWKSRRSLKTGPSRLFLFSAMRADEEERIFSTTHVENISLRLSWQNIFFTSSPSVGPCIRMGLPMSQ
mmetsp:Transcript_56213/g.149477  ORF Transcript_56213/g.149477 Transcript_56213/m.149477 type:complete len:348 (-) Transcript_56213:554-1597(-)